MGKVVQVSQPHAPNAAAIWTIYTYDALGRTPTITTPDGSVTSYAYAGNVTTVTDAAHNWKKFTTEALGNLVTVTEPDPSLGNVNTSYTYDMLNSLTQVSMTRGSAVQNRYFNYTSGRLTSVTNPENGTVTYTYNADASVATRTDNKGQQVKYSYDSFGRVTQVRRYPNGPNNPEDTAQQTNYSYDTNPFPQDTGLTTYFNTSWAAWLR